MKALKISIQQAFFIVAIPLVIALVVAVIVSGREMLAVSEHSETVFYDHLFKISSNVTNADRDFYQAMLAAADYHDNITPRIEEGRTDFPFDPDEKLADYEENVQQTLDRVAEAANIARQDNTI